MWNNKKWRKFLAKNTISWPQENEYKDGWLYTTFDDGNRTKWECSEEEFSKKVEFLRYICSSPFYFYFIKKRKEFQITFNEKEVLRIKNFNNQAKFDSLFQPWIKNEWYKFASNESWWSSDGAKWLSNFMSDAVSKTATNIFNVLNNKYGN